MNKKYLIPLFVFLVICLKGNAQNRISARDKFDWKAFDAQSTIVPDSITYQSLQGNWIAYQGKHYSTYEIAWSTGNRPKTLQIKGRKYRKNLAGDFNPFVLKNNLIIFYNGNKADSAYINLITKTALTISFKTGPDFDQYEYKK